MATTKTEPPTSTSSPDPHGPVTAVDPGPELRNGQPVVVLDSDGNAIRFGFVVDADGRTPNLEHRDPTSNRLCPESREPVVLWLPGHPAPYGGPITALA